MRISYEWLGEAPVKRHGQIERLPGPGNPVRGRFSGFGPKSAPNHRDFGPGKVWN